MLHTSGKWQDDHSLVLVYICTLFYAKTDDILSSFQDVYLIVGTESDETVNNYIKYE